MANIVKLSIKNFRGIKDFKLNLENNKNFICLVGRGDSGKTTILEAISYVLSPAWNLTFYDTDFYNCTCTESIEIEVTLINFSDELLAENKYGLWQKGYNPSNNILSDEVKDGYLPALSIRLTVKQNLEPEWEVVNEHEQENKAISATDRAKFNCFLVSDYIDRHFSWNKGNPLYSLLKLNDGSFNEADKNVVLDAIRQAKEIIDGHENETLKKTAQNVINQTAVLGLDITKCKTAIDFRDISLREGRVCLHDDKIPFRLKGKGSKRLISIAIQIALAQQGGIILIDEIEQGLEPDRIKLLARTLRHNSKGQIFITTHSRDVITEIGAGDLVIVHSDWKKKLTISQKLDYNEEKLQGVVRACPEAFFAKKIIVCEGATEIGICRALDKFRQDHGKDLISFRNCAYVDGGGTSQVERSEHLKEVGFVLSLLCDSDVQSINDKKSDLEGQNIKIFDCENNNSIEQQLFKDLPWEAIKELIEYVKDVHNKDDNAISESFKSKYGENFPENWLNYDTVPMRDAIASTVKNKEWFKRIDHGEKLGDILFQYWDKMDDTKRTKRIFTELSEWVDA